MLEMQNLRTTFSPHYHLSSALHPFRWVSIPFDAFAEAEGPKGKMTRTWMSVTDQELPAWAGLWRPTDEWGNAYTGVMVDANDELMEIHDRMPVILHARDHDTWLNAPPEEAMKLVQKYPASKIAVERTDELWARKRTKS